MFALVIYYCCFYCFFNVVLNVSIKRVYRNFLNRNYLRLESHEKRLQQVAAFHTTFVKFTYFFIFQFLKVCNKNCNKSCVVRGLKRLSLMEVKTTK